MAALLNFCKDTAFTMQQVSSFEIASAIFRQLVVPVMVMILLLTTMPSLSRPRSRASPLVFRSVSLLLLAGRMTSQAALCQVCLPCDATASGKDVWHALTMKSNLSSLDMPTTEVDIFHNDLVLLHQPHRNLTALQLSSLYSRLSSFYFYLDDAVHDDSIDRALTRQGFAHWQLKVIHTDAKKHQSGPLSFHDARKLAKYLDVLDGQDKDVGCTDLENLVYFRKVFGPQKSA